MIDRNKNEEVIIKRSEDGELVVSSRQVAEDFGKNHKEVLRAIENHVVTLGGAQNCANLFIESKYQHEQNKQWYKEYLLTKDGFAFAVMSFTGEESARWKLKYIEAFNKMEQAIKNPFAHLSKELQAIIAIDTKVQKIEEDFNTFKSNLPLLNVDCKELQAEVRKKGIEVLGGYRSAAYNNKSLRSRTYQDIQYQIKREFGVNRYEAIKSRQVDKAIEIIRDYKVPYVLADEITMINNQVCFND